MTTVHLLTLTAPVGEDELTFWRRKAGERARLVAELERELLALRERIEELEAEQ